MYQVEGAHWRHLTNTTEPSMCDGDAACCQITLTTCFWATVRKTVRPILSDRCPVSPVLSVTLVYCGQTVGRIKMKLGLQLGLGPGHIVLDGDPAPLPTKGAPNFWPISVVVKWLHGSRYHLVWR